MMRMKDDLLRPGYNTEITTSNQYILNPTIHQNGSDSPTFIPHVEQLKKRVEGLVSSDWSPDMTTDAGYGSEENYEYAKAEKIRAFIKYFSWYEEYTGALSKKPFRKENWYYNDAENYFLCPNEKKLTYRETRELTTANGYVRLVESYECESCLDCPLFKKCRHDRAKPDSNRTIQFSKKLEAFKEEAKVLLASEEGLEKRSKRGTEVETPFGNIKYNMGHRRFFLRGLEKVSIEFSLLAIAHNIRKVYCEKTGIWEEFYAQRAARRKEKSKKRA